MGDGPVGELYAEKNLSFELPLLWNDQGLRGYTAWAVSDVEPILMDCGSNRLSGISTAPSGAVVERKAGSFFQSRNPQGGVMRYGRDACCK